MLNGSEYSFFQKCADNFGRYPSCPIISDGGMSPCDCLCGRTHPETETDFRAERSVFDGFRKVF